MYGCIVPSAERTLSTLLLEDHVHAKNDVHWFEVEREQKEYEWRSTRATRRSAPSRRSTT
jgi:hypothetical protein